MCQVLIQGYEYISEQNTQGLRCNEESESLNKKKKKQPNKCQMETDAQRARGGVTRQVVS